MLGRLRMSVDECIGKYKEFMGMVFKHGLLKPIGVLVGSELYSASTLETIIKELIKERLGRDDANLFDEDDGVVDEKCYGGVTWGHGRSTDCCRIRHG